MKVLQSQPSLVEQAYEAILSEIASGKLPSGARIVQEQLAHQLGVSRQPIQHALTLLRKQGVLQDAPGRGLQVSPIDMEHVRHMYEIRAVLEGLAFRGAAETQGAKAAAKCAALLKAGRKASTGSSVPSMISADMAFHEAIYALSGNPLIAPAMQANWTLAQRVMGEVLIRDDKPRDVWEQHEALLEAVAAGDGERAESLARKHIMEAADFMIERLTAERANA